MVDERIQIRNALFQRSTIDSFSDQNFQILLRKKKRASIANSKRTAFIQTNGNQKNLGANSPTMRKIQGNLIPENDLSKRFILKLNSERETNEIIYNLSNFTQNIRSNHIKFEFDDETVKTFVEFAKHENLKIKYLTFSIISDLFATSVEITQKFFENNIIEILMGTLIQNEFLSVAKFILLAIKSILHNIPDCIEMFCTENAISVFIKLLEYRYREITERTLDLICVILNSFAVISELLLEKIISNTISLLKTNNENLLELGLHLIYSALKKNKYILQHTGCPEFMMFLIQNINSDSRSLVSQVRQFIIFLIYISEEYSKSLISYGLGEFLNTIIENKENSLVNFILVCLSNLFKYKDIAETLLKKHLIKDCLNMLSNGSDQIKKEILLCLLRLTDYQEGYFAFELYQLNIIESLLPLLSFKDKSIKFAILRIFHNLFECLSNVSTGNMYYKITNKFLSVGGYDAFELLFLDNDKTISIMARDFMQNYIILE